jgi:hypothetical protein
VARQKLVGLLGEAVLGGKAIARLDIFKFDQQPILAFARPSIALDQRGERTISPSDKSTRMNARTAASNSASVTPGFSSNSWMPMTRGMIPSSLRPVH